MRQNLPSRRHFLHVRIPIYRNPSFAPIFTPQIPLSTAQIHLKTLSSSKSPPYVFPYIGIRHLNPQTAQISTFQRSKPVSSRQNPFQTDFRRSNPLSTAKIRSKPVFTAQILFQPPKSHFSELYQGKFAFLPFQAKNFIMKSKF